MTKMKDMRMACLLATAAVWATACPESEKETNGDVDRGTESGDDTDENAYSTCGYDERVGGFLVYLDNGQTRFIGSVSDGVFPVSVPFELRKDGVCTLFGPPDLFCDPACMVLGETCGESGVCVTAPVKKSAGLVTVVGLSAPVEVAPNEITLDYSATIDDPYPGFDEGANITLEAAGGEVAPFTLNARGVSAIETSDTEVSVERESPVTLTWTPSDTPSAHIYVELIVDYHGASTDGWIVCDAPDSGALTIPAGLVTDLIDLGLSGFPRVDISRRSADSIDLASGCVELIVHSKITLPVQVPGLDSCSDDNDCEEGETCQEDLVCG